MLSGSVAVLGGGWMGVGHGCVGCVVGWRRAVRQLIFTYGPYGSRMGGVGRKSRVITAAGGAR